MNRTAIVLFAAVVLSFATWSAEDPLQKTVQVNITAKAADATIKELCTAAGLEAEIELIKPEPESFDPSSLRGSGSSSSKQDGFSFSCRSAAGDRLYTIQCEKAVALKKLFELFLPSEGLAVESAGTKLKFKPIFSLPFNQDAPIGLYSDFKSDANWQSLIGEIIAARNTPPLTSKRAIQNMQNMRMNREAPPELKRVMTALKGHLQSDAVRAWLLLEAAIRIPQNTNSGDAGPAAHTIAAINSAKEIIEKPDGAILLKELADVLRPLASKQEAAQPDKYFLTKQAAYAYLSAARAYATLKQPSRSLESAKLAAYALLEFNDDGFFEAYHKVVSGNASAGVWITRGGLVTNSGEKWLKVASEDVQQIDALKVSAEIKARAHLRLARAYYKNKQGAKALEEIQLAMKLDPVNGGAVRETPEIKDPRFATMSVNEQPEATIVNVTVDCASMLKENDKEAEAIQLLEKLQKDRPKDPAVFQESAQFFRFTLKNDEKAVACIKQLLALNPNDEDALNALAALEKRTVAGKDKNGFDRQVAPEVAEKYKKIAEIHKVVQALKAEKKFDEALKAVRELLKTYPGTGDLILQEVHLLVRLEKLDDAAARLDEYEKATAKDFMARQTAGNLRDMIDEIKTAKTTGAAPPPVPEDF